MSDTEKLDALLAAYKQVEAELYSISKSNALNHFDRRALLPDQDVQEAVALLFERLDKQDRILTALRDASMAVLADARKQFGYDQYAVGCQCMDTLRAAVAAAEQEVGRE